MLPIDARRRILEPYRERLRRLVRQQVAGVVPLTREGWRAVLADARLDQAAVVLDALADPLLDAPMLVKAASRLVDTVEDLADDLQLIDCYVGIDGRGSTVRDALMDTANAAMEAAIGTEPNDFEQRRSILARNLAHLIALEDEVDFANDPCEAAFGVPYAELRDEAGIFSSTRLLSAYCGRYGELEDRLNVFTSLVSPTRLDVLHAVAPAEALVLPPRPLVALRTARRVYALIEGGMRRDPEVVAGPLRDLKLRVDRSEANHRAMIRLLAQVNTAQTAADRAELTLDFYRRMVEGQLRPWAWALLRIAGRNSAHAPEVASLREQLLAESRPLFSDAAEAILPAARNASAHEDYVFDPPSGLLSVGDSVVEVASLERASDHAYSFMAGAECAWVCARQSIAELARRLDAHDTPVLPRAAAKRVAISHFGTNGLHVSRWTLDQGVLTVLLDDLPAQRVNPCFQAAMWATRHLDEAERVVVTLPARDLPVCDLPRVALDATFFVWCHARSKFSEMPVSTFLPANAAARLAVELPDDAARSVAWIGVNDAVHAYNDAHEAPGSVKERVELLVARLEIVVDALAATMTTLPLGAATLLGRAMEAVGAGATSALAAAHGLSASEAGLRENHIRDLHEAHRPVEYLPTLLHGPTRG